VIVSFSPSGNRRVALRFLVSMAVTLAVTSTLLTVTPPGTPSCTAVAVFTWAGGGGVVVAQAASVNRMAKSKVGEKVVFIVTQMVALSVEKP